MQTSPKQDLVTIDPRATEMLGEVRSQMGFVPNVFSALSRSTPALAAFIDLNQHFGVSSFTDDERETVQLAASVERESRYCVAGHSRFAHDQHTDEGVIEALRTTKPLENARLEVLARFTRALIRGDGRVSRDELERFYAGGYAPEQVLEVILGICVKTLSNFTTNAMSTALDEPFAPFEWQQVG